MGGYHEIKNDNVRLKAVCKQLMKMVIFIIAPVLMIMGVLAEPLFRFLFTEKWLPAVPYFQILCINGVLFPLHSYNLNILSVKGRSDLILRLEIVNRSLFPFFPHLPKFFVRILCKILFPLLLHFHNIYKT